MLDDVRAELAAHGVLRAGFNMSNQLLVTGKTPEGEPIGVARDMAESIAKALGVPLKCSMYSSAGTLSDLAGDDVWDVCMIGDEPARAEVVSFSGAYVEIKGTYLVRDGSALKTAAEMDQAGLRMILRARTAYELWLTRNIKHAEMTLTETHDEALARFMAEGFDALAGLEERLLEDMEITPGTRMLEGAFASVQQAVGTPKKNVAGAAFLRQFVEEAKASGAAAASIERHKVKGLSVAALSAG